MNYELDLRNTTREMLEDFLLNENYSNLFVLCALFGNPR